MKFVIQKVTHASVTVESQIIGKIGKGFFVLIGIAENDTQEIADKMIKKLLGLRIFEDENGKTNLSLRDVNGQLLLVSQFTLYADCRKGNRPSFTKAGNPKLANELYEYFVKKLKEKNIKVQTGKFRAMMDVELVNDGPVTFWLEK